MRSNRIVDFRLMYIKVDALLVAIEFACSDFVNARLHLGCADLFFNEH